jgi:hypothetical protein
MNGGKLKWHPRGIWICTRKFALMGCTRKFALVDLQPQVCTHGFAPESLHTLAMIIIDAITTTYYHNLMNEAG